MKNRIELVKYFAELGFTNGAEIGVLDGRFSEILCKTIPNLKLIAVDSWSNKKVYPTFKIAQERLAPYDVTIIHDTSVNAAIWVKDESLDFVFIDANHLYDFVAEDIKVWTPKVKKGGIVSGHDYYESKTGNLGVILAVNEYVKEHNYELKLTDWDLENPVKDDRQPSWYFVK